MKLKKPSMNRQPSAVPGTLVPLLLMLTGLAAAGVLLWALLFGPTAEHYRLI